MDVTIRLLGPTDVAVLPSLSPRDRVILSAICVQPGSVVSAESLAEALWGERPPKSWPKVIQGAVMRLRRALGASAIETSARGYRAVLADHTLDTLEFERLVARGRSFQAVHEPERAASAFEQALSLWRGAPFAELNGWDPAVAEAGRLQDVRLAVEEDLVAAHLDAGRAVDAAAEVRPLVAREPFRERRWALLATALYRTGRQGEALDVLRQAARTLRDELAALRVRDCVLGPAPSVRVARRFYRVAGRVTVDTPKSEAGARVVPLPQTVAQEVRDHLARHRAGAGPNDLVFVTAGGRDVPDTASQVVRRGLDRIGRSDARAHDLRHTALTAAAEHGATLATLMQMAGHSTSAAAQRYQHATLTHARQVAGAIDASLGDVLMVSRAEPRAG